MAQRAVAIKAAGPAWVAAALVLALTVGPLVAVAFRAQVGSGLAAGDWAAIRFTIWQAVVSALASVALAIPVARALARRRFRGRAALVMLLGAPFLLPVIVAVLGLLAVFGRGGILNAMLGTIGIDPISIYGAAGVILAHVFFNLPLAVRLILQGWLDIPAERFRLAAQLNAPVWRVLEWPMLVRVLPGTLLVIFLICLTSFAVALTLGGGPRATTVELAIYQAIRFDFDLGRAALLAASQFVLCAVAAVVAWRITPVDGLGGGLDRVVARWDQSPLDWLWLGAVTLFLVTPLAMIVLRGVPGFLDMPASVWTAAGRSIAVAVGSTVISVSLALTVALRGGAIAQVIGVTPLASSALVMGTGLFIIVYPVVSPTVVALPVTMVVNAMLALPFALRVLIPAVQDVRQNYARLAATLNLTGWRGLRIVMLPRLRRPLGFAAGLSAALSMGDLGVIALFATDAQETLPLAMYRLMGAYRMETAASAALLLVALSLLAFWICDKGGRVDADL
ncbi:thiamine/thiamine pyrophosphate ABC transporter permease ThiP [Loktanella sp. SALINAS62]|uniref:thiamine/thiamine pyrophosphate ABC transporter permease ThiP n=1 Tax=Loktanella sp. SALINAS62 TaxID=2706124 RepID=UPI001B8C6A26|nr:thiamine/thiamine pyrophosphate ABC transporter permease ThiP [Loktanella sp. SALINAS62]MBS1302266.1 thiamine/thiamine pyrophosphate ABC transporter permease ThiP [Loktanella sp. SALINAS62]